MPSLSAASMRRGHVALLGAICLDLPSLRHIFLLSRHDLKRLQVVKGTKDTRSESMLQVLVAVLLRADTMPIFPELRGTCRRQLRRWVTQADGVDLIEY